MGDIDMVNSPPHYRTVNGVQCLEVVEALGLNFHVGNCLKYLWRAGRKDPLRELEDLKKARFYLDREIQRRESTC